MFECLLLGDDLALGISKYKPECAVVASPGINSEQWVNNNLSSVQASKITIISLTSYDDLGVLSRRNLYEIRERIKVGKVFWIMPLSTSSTLNLKAMLEVVASEYKDSIISVAPKERSKDNKHPTEEGYQNIARKIK
jgi:hypothetical protein